jgi:hypothetical protein
MKTETGRTGRAKKTRAAKKNWPAKHSPLKMNRATRYHWIEEHKRKPDLSKGKRTWKNKERKSPRFMTSQRDDE